MKLSPASFQKRLLDWFDQHGRKSLPWQKNKTAYRVWVSEIMLQQTQVSTVIAYYERFMQRFTDLEKLAFASEDEVLHLWAGLGYYSRARNLHRAAQKIMHEFAGEFPRTLEEVQSLPGIGRSTAGAILSIAFNQPTAILDGNVKRVLARLHGILEPVNEKKTEEKMWELAEQYTPVKRVADYTQAVMDLGATFCTRSHPQCEACPFKKVCVAFLQDKVETLPVKKATRKIPTKQATFVIIKKGEEVLLRKRPSSGIWGGLFSLPEIVGEPETKAIKVFCQQHFRLSVQAPAIQVLEPFRHTFSHYHLDIFPVVVEINKPVGKVMEDNGQIWYNLRKPGSVGLPKPVQSLLRGLV